MNAGMVAFGHSWGSATSSSTAVRTPNASLDGCSREMETSDKCQCEMSFVMTKNETTVCYSYRNSIVSTQI